MKQQPATIPINGSVIDRQAFLAQLTRLTNDALHSTRQHGLIVVDIDALRFVNASNGFAAGDYLLKLMSDHLVSMMQHGYIAAYLDAGSFGILLPNTEYEDLCQLAETLVESVRRREFHWQDRVFHITLSAGATMLRDSDGDASEVFARAEIALFRAKREGGNCMRFGVDVDAGGEELAVSWAPKIHYAFLHDGFHLWCQPVVSLDSREVELLDVSYTLDVNGNAIAAEDFRSELVALGMSITLDRWLIRKLRAIVLTAHARGDHKRYLFKVSAESVKAAEFWRFLNAEITQHPVLCKAVILALPHNVLCDAFESMKSFVDKLHEMGAVLALDDYGAGLDSLLQLRHLSVEYVRFLPEILAAYDSSDRASVLASLVRAEGKRAIASGVDTEADLLRVRENGFVLGQGGLLPKRRCQ